MDFQHIQIVLFTTFGLILVLIVYFVMRQILSYQRKRDEQEHRERTQVTFVVDTFHDLMSKLKEKERELEALRSRAEERASSVELYNENIIQSVPSGVVSFDQDLRITRINHAALAILGLSEAETIGKTSAEIFQSPIREMIADRKVLERAETAYTCGSGKRLWIGLALSPLKDSVPSVIGHLLVFTDLTELKAFQSQKELRDRLSTLGEMSAGIAHELRNPMAVISGYTRILSKKVDDPLRPAVAAINKEIMVMDRIIGDFLTFARPADPVFGKIDLADLLKSCVETIEESAQNIRILMDAPAEIMIRADEVFMRQAISNLLQNAVEAMPEGGEINISCAVEGDKRLLTLADTGHGIPENIRDKIFLPFYTTKEHGTGLGLAIVHKIIVSHNGAISVDSSPQGTAFTIVFPKEVVVNNLS
ncbi:MAG: PAS domain-containing protein [Nitrospirae bacterium]|nr:PAS domain-containing protein [Nitrospirota bacterium]